MITSQIKTLTTSLENIRQVLHTFSLEFFLLLKMIDLILLSLLRILRKFRPVWTVRSYLISFWRHIIKLFFFKCRHLFGRQLVCFHFMRFLFCRSLNLFGLVSLKLKLPLHSFLGLYLLSMSLFIWVNKLFLFLSNSLKDRTLHKFCWFFCWL